MKAPDKIYIREYPDGIARFWEEKKKEDVVATIPHEYIRKDAILEWIEGKMTVEEETEGYIGGYDAALKEVVDKLNSL